MMKNSLRKMVTAVIAATTIGSFSSLGVSAATLDSNANNKYNTATHNHLNKGWVMNHGRWHYFDNAGKMQTGVIKVNNKTYCLNQLGMMETGKVVVNNKEYTTNSDGDITGNTTPVVDKVFDSNNNVVKDNNKTSTVSTSTNTNGTTAGTGSTTNVESSKNTTNASTSTSSVDIQGLPKLPTNYSISVQASAEQKILELMNAKRTEAGLQPLTMDNTLVQVARYKSNDMIQNNFFDHTNPDGTKWTNWLQDIGYKYTTTGENIAYNTSDPVELFNQWWNSPGHRANMMNSSYNKVGIGVIFGNGKYMGSQEFSN
ncbi:CAP domain-containing protein [Clostridium chromiireducens]|uniref:Cysteine-rich secretory protein family protein n=1 Tax=Clostridium chromiireducens TaxID=225345 RepID=A0A1V4IIA9_9CLOT|nr:CAP domain-containing protein [Clostridium chromiireducens]OPJ59683.1 cysteine-rich secretory protein family protein [Clostridium chromiireducens]